MTEKICMKGFHGTLQSKAVKILADTFIISSKNTEWLGQGIYFFSEIRDARIWAEREARKPHNKKELPCVIIVDIYCDAKHFLNLDIPQNRKKVEQRIELIKNVKGAPNFKSSHQMRCYYLNLYKRLENVKVMVYTFPKVIDSDIGIPVLLKQKQICLTDDSCIENKRGENDEFFI